MRLRLEMLDIEETVAAFRELLELASAAKGPQPRRTPRRIMEAVQVAHDAIRARERIRDQKPVPPRWLAAAGNVATSRVRQLLREGGLERVGTGVEPSSAARWLSRADPIFAGRRRLVATAPSWWSRVAGKFLFYSLMEQTAVAVLPAGCTFRFDVSDTPCFEVAPWARLDDPTVEQLRALVRAALEPLGPEPPDWTRGGDDSIEDECSEPSRPPPSPPHGAM